MSSTPSEAARLTAIAGRVKDAVRMGHPGGCRILSEGEGCTCPLCDVDRLSAHVETLTQQVADWAAANEVIRQDFEDAKEENARLTAERDRKTHTDSSQPKVCADPTMCCRELTRIWAALGNPPAGTHAHEHVANLKQQRDAAHAALRQAEALLDKVAPWICKGCGPHIKVDEDGCCVHCGADAALAASAPQKGNKP